MIAKTLTTVTVWLLVLAVVIVSVPAQTQSSRVRQPNILIILVDDLGYGDLGSYGAKDLRTPNIDALVRGGMRFDNFYANSPVCSPTRAALMTGKYPDMVGVPGVIRTHADNSWGYLSTQSVLLPQLLKKMNYHTALVGKWHLGLESPNTPLERGFDRFHGFLGDMMDDYYNHRRHSINYMRRDAQTIDPPGHATDLFTEWSISYLNERRESLQPFFLYLAYTAPHTPVQPPPEWLTKVRHREPGISDKRAKLVALIEHLDQGIGRVVETLKANGQSENTLIVFTSDNGGQLDVGANSGPVRGGKQDLYEGGIRVPACVTWTNQIRPGSRSDRTALTMDILPTVCEAAGVKVDHSIDGASLLPTLLSRNQPPLERDLFWMRREGGAPYFGQDYYAIRRGPWKLMQNKPFELLQLYNLEADPMEQRDLAAENRPLFNALSSTLSIHLQRAGMVPWQKSSR